MSNETDRMIDAADFYASAYEGDDRPYIGTDVRNAFYAGWVACMAYNKRELHDRVTVYIE